MSEIKIEYIPEVTLEGIQEFKKNAPASFIEAVIKNSMPSSMLQRLFNGEVTDEELRLLANRSQFFRYYVRRTQVNQPLWEKFFEVYNQLTPAEQTDVSESLMARVNRPDLKSAFFGANPDLKNTYLTWVRHLLAQAK